MLLFDTELRESKIHGIGVFLLEPVREGDVIWRFDSRIDRVYSDWELAELPPRRSRARRIPQDGRSCVRRDVNSELLL